MWGSRAGRYTCYLGCALSAVCRVCGACMKLVSALSWHVANHVHHNILRDVGMSINRAAIVYVTPRTTPHNHISRDRCGYSGVYRKSTEIYSVSQSVSPGAAWITTGALRAYKG